MIKDEVEISNDILSHFLEQHTSDVDQREFFQKVSEKRINDLHSMAYIYYQNHYYLEADSCFRLLVTINPQESKFWKGLGACLQMKKNYEGALNCYRCAQSLLKEKPNSYLYLHIADCHFAMKNLQEGFLALELAQKIAKKTKDQKVINHISFMNERWKKNKKIHSKIR